MSNLEASAVLTEVSPVDVVRSFESDLYEFSTRDWLTWSLLVIEIVVELRSALLPAHLDLYYEVWGSLLDSLDYNLDSYVAAVFWLAKLLKS